jgi:acyl-CoA synthetase (AMP-forming)/AMP-acid ligase II
MNTVENIPIVLQRMAVQRPDHPMIEYQGRIYTYRIMANWWNNLAEQILRHPKIPPGPICVSGTCFPAMVAGYLAAMQAGRTCVGIAPDWPPDRIAAVVREVRAAGLLTWDAGSAVTSSFGSLPVIPICDPDMAIRPLRSPASRSLENPVSHILLTSGTTGRSKLVPRRHLEVLQNEKRHSSLGLGPTDRVTLFTRGGYFDSIGNPYCAWFNGATIVAIDFASGDEMSMRLSDMTPTVYYSFPTIWRHILRSEPEPQQLRSLRLVYLGGEKVEPSDLLACKSLLRPEAEVASGLGCTETGLVSLGVWKAQAIPDCPVPSVGWPVDGVSVSIRDVSGARVNRGQIGELVVTSPYIFTGYLGQSKATNLDGAGETYRTGDLAKESDVGEIFLVGRADNQVKIRGYRIELEEIDSRVRELPGVLDAAAVVAPGPTGDELHLHVAPAGLTAVYVREKLRGSLPAHFIPDQIHFHASLPRTVNGKIDRNGLRVAAFATQSSSSEPSMELLEEVLRIWSRLLGPPPAQDSQFFEHGGNSIKAATLVAQLRRSRGVQFPLAYLMENPRLDEFLARCSELEAECRK